MTLEFNNSELHYLRGTNEYSERMFKEDYLEFLRKFKQKSKLTEADAMRLGKEVSKTISNKLRATVR